MRKAPAKRTRAYVFQAAFAALIVVMALMSVSRARGFSDMIGYWRSAVSQTEKPVARNLLGVAYRNQGRYQEAMRQYERAFRLDPDFTVARMNQAEIWLRKKKYEDAARILEELALTGDLSPALIKNLDYAYSFQGGWEARTKKWKREIEQNPESVDARLLLALYYLEVRGDERAARAQLEAAGRTDPQHPLVRALSPGPPGKGDGSVSAP